MIKSFVFRDKSQGITARQVRARGADAASEAAIFRSNTSASAAKSVTSNTSNADSLKHFRHTSKDESFLPSYHTPSPEIQQQSKMPVSPSLYSRATWCSKKKLFGRKRDSVGPPLPVNISAPLTSGSQFSPWVTRPDSTLHPSRSGESETQRWKSEI